MSWGKPRHARISLQTCVENRFRFSANRETTDVTESANEFESVLSDTELLCQLEAGHEEAATVLYHRYAERLIRLAGKRSTGMLSNRVEAEDIVQSVFRTFFRRAVTGHYKLPEGEEIWKLFLVISLNKIRKKAEFYGAAKRDVKRTQAIGDQQLASADTSSQVLQLTIEELISRLPTQHQGVIRDRIQGYDVGEMASRNQLSRRSVERILQSFRQQMQLELVEDGNE